MHPAGKRFERSCIGLAPPGLPAYPLGPLAYPPGPLGRPEAREEVPPKDEETLIRQEEPPAREAATGLSHAAIRPSKAATHFPQAAGIFPYPCNSIDIFLRERLHPLNHQPNLSLTLMGESIEFIKNRAIKTLSAADSVAASWTWDEKPIAAMRTQLHGLIGDTDAAPPLIGQEEIVSTAEQAMKAGRSAWDTKLDQLHLWTMQGLGMVRNKYRNDPATLSQFDGLKSDGTSRSNTLSEALAWQSAWEKTDPSFIPMPANTLANFKALREQCVNDLQTAYSDLQSTWRRAASKLTQMGRAMEDVSEAWYADATRIFPAGTPEGDMIRSTVPTTYNGPGGPGNPPTPPVPPTP